MVFQSRKKRGKIITKLWKMITKGQTTLSTKSRWRFRTKRRSKESFDHTRLCKFRFHINRLVTVRQRETRTNVEYRSRAARLENDEMTKRVFLHPPRSLNVGKYQNGTSYTRVSARHNWDARAPLWVNVSKGFRAKNFLSPSSLPAHCRSWEHVVFATFDRIRLPTPFLTQLLYWNSPSQTDTIVVNFIQQEIQSKVVPRSCQLECVGSVKKKELSKRTQRKNKKKKKKKKKKN